LRGSHTGRRHLRAANQTTIFAPTDDALARLDRNLPDRLFLMIGGARQPDPVLVPGPFALR
jgi:hypothetical protein